MSVCTPCVPGVHCSFMWEHMIPQTGITGAGNESIGAGNETQILGEKVLLTFVPSLQPRFEMPAQSMN